LTDGVVEGEEVDERGHALRVDAAVEKVQHRPVQVQDPKSH